MQGYSCRSPGAANVLIIISSSPIMVPSVHVVGVAQWTHHSSRRCLQVSAVMPQIWSHAKAIMCNSSPAPDPTPLLVHRYPDMQTFPLPASTIPPPPFSQCCRLAAGPAPHLGVDVCLASVYHSHPAVLELQSASHQHVTAVGATVHDINLGQDTCAPQCHGCSRLPVCMTTCPEV